MKVTALTVRIGLLLATYFAVESIMRVQAQAPGDVGSEACRRAQLAMQAEVTEGKVIPYQTLDARINATAALVGTAVGAGTITGACANCIIGQMFSGVRIDDQVTCGPPATPTPATPPARRRTRSPVPTSSR